MDCGIRAWQLSDAKDLAAVFSDAGIRDNLRDGLPDPYTEADGREYIGAVLGAPASATFAFAVAADGRCVGSISVIRQENVRRLTCELGYCLAREYWGKGIMT